MHVRMQSQENVEISNPMYLREDADEDVESLDPGFVLASSKVSFFIRLDALVVTFHVHFNLIQFNFGIFRPLILLTLSTNQCTTMRRQAAVSTKKRKDSCKVNRRILSSRTKTIRWLNIAKLLRKFHPSHSSYCQRRRRRR